jgi:hypothetical protein
MTAGVIQLGAAVSSECVGVAKQGRSTCQIDQLGVRVSLYQFLTRRKVKPCSKRIQPHQNRFRWAGSPLSISLIAGQCVQISRPPRHTEVRSAAAERNPPDMANLRWVADGGHRQARRRPCAISERQKVQDEPFKLKSCPPNSLQDFRLQGVGTHVGGKSESRKKSSAASRSALVSPPLYCRNPSQPPTVAPAACWATIGQI